MTVDERQKSRLEEIPQELVWDFDIRHPDGVNDPLKHFDKVRAAGAPPIFYTPRNGGHWVFGDYESVTTGYMNTELFSSYPAVIPFIENLWQSKPQGVDPPDHTKYRLPLVRAFSPKAIKGLENDIRAHVVELIETLKPRGGCEFVREFAFSYSPAVFMRMMGMDLSRLAEFVSWTQRFSHGTPDDAAEVMGLVSGYMAEFIKERETNPTDDLGGAVANLREESGAMFSFQDRLNMCTLLFMAGLDTVANSLVMMWRLMAEQPEVRARVAANLEDPKGTVDELLRYNTVAALARRVTRDEVFRGVQLKAGDQILLTNVLANHDPVAFADPLNVDLGRDASKHVSFGHGIHRCVGQFLAKTEIAIALQEWLPRIPDFELAGTPKPLTGQISGYSEMKLKWPV